MSTGTASTTKRLMFLEKLTRDGSKDPMAWYGLAMEYRSLERADDAVQTFQSLRSSVPDYIPMYLMCAQTLRGINRTEDAREWLTAGAVVAKKAGNSHALSEIEDALAALS